MVSVSAAALQAPSTNENGRHSIKEPTWYTFALPKMTENRC